MADQFAYPGMQQPPGGYPQFHYPTANGDQNAQLLQGYGLPQQGNVPGGPGVFGGPSPSPYNFDQAGGFTQTSVPVCQGGPGSLPPGAGGGFGYADFAGSFNQYPAGMGQNVPPNIALQAGLGNDMQHFGPLMNAFGQPMPNSGAMLEAIAHDQGLAGINPMSFFQDPSGGVSRGGGNMARSGQRGGYNKFGGNRSNQNLPSVTNPDGLREDTVFVSNLPINIDHETMKAQFGVIGKIKINPKSGMPMVWIFKEKGIPKGEALVTFDDPSSVQAAIKHFSEREFLGRKVEVKQATNSQRPVIIPPGGGAAQNPSLMMGGGPPGGGYHPYEKSAAAFAAAVAAVAAEASGNTMASLMNNSSAAAASLAALTECGTPFNGPKDFNIGRSRGGRGGGINGGPSGGRGSGTGSTQAGTREGDWTCVHCCNVNFSWREVCNRCQASRAQDMMDGGEMSAMNPRQMPHIGRGGSSGSIPVVNAGQPGGFGRGGPLVPPAPGRGGGRGGGPMRGSGVGVGRARPAPY